MAHFLSFLFFYYMKGKGETYKKSHTIVCDLMLLSVVGFADGFGQLVSAGGGAGAAGVARQGLFDLIDGHAFDQFADGFEVAVAAARECYITDDIAIQIEGDGGGAGAPSFISIGHDFPPKKQQRCPKTAGTFVKGMKRMMKKF